MNPSPPGPSPQRGPEPEPSSGPIAIRHSLLLAASTYGLGQIANFLFQLRLLDQLGPSTYGAVGLAHLLLITSIFLADLGYASLFLRERGGSSEWERTWRYALGHRLVATLLLLAAVMIGWMQWSDDGASRQYLAGAAAACLFALFNYSSPMIVEGRRLGGLLVAQIAWPSALVIWCLLQYAPPLSTSAAAGISVSLGYLVQALVSVICSRRLRLWLPLAGKGQLGSAFHLSLLSVWGTLHDRLTPFLLAPLAPTFLPFFLILNHVLSGLSGVLAQFSRLLLPEAQERQGRRHILSAASLVCWGSTAVILGGLLLHGLELSNDQRQWLALSAIVLLAWGVSASSGFLSILLIGARQERPLSRLLGVGLALSALLQAGAAWIGDADYLLWARVLGLLAVLAGLLVLLKLRPSPWGMAALSLSVLACALGIWHWSMVIGLVLLLPTLAALWRRSSCYVEAPLR
ncbi:MULTISPECIES: hypothetical protein [unclassified Pseudomonas]|uniref:hypothetical protein n=1 Tax=unclassified Pseudomonas TaxID=196821 RepID=UPI0024495880|nr:MULTISPECIES: hypothetical protein [unclassified Pseudomonas]MDH0895928.1 hypothetical protein [Pseudomonas sp. GD03875]MDH1067165.1 hypothetical protein [Pseudomonas sp. GD03985]